MTTAVITKPIPKLKSEVTLVEASEIIGETQLTLIRLLDDKVIPFHLSRGMRVIAQSDLEHYNAIEFDRCGRVLNELVEETERLGLYN